MRQAFFISEKFDRRSGVFNKSATLSRATRYSNPFARVFFQTRAPFQTTHIINVRFNLNFRFLIVELTQI